jgi:hypothetical protein
VGTTNPANSIGVDLKTRTIPPISPLDSNKTLAFTWSKPDKIEIQKVVFMRRGNHYASLPESENPQLRMVFIKIDIDYRVVFMSGGP